MSIAIKDNSVQARSLSPQLLLAVVVADGVLAEHGVQTVITSLNDGTHGDTSLHYAGCAVDLRTHGLKDPAAVVQEIKRRLNIDWDVLLESTHIHIEYQPRRR